MFLKGYMFNVLWGFLTSVWCFLSKVFLPLCQPSPLFVRQFVLEIICVNIALFQIQIEGVNTHETIKLKPLDKLVRLWSILSMFGDCFIILGVNTYSVNIQEVTSYFVFLFSICTFQHCSWLCEVRWYPQRKNLFFKRSNDIKPNHHKKQNIPFYCFRTNRWQVFKFSTR